MSQFSKGFALGALVLLLAGCGGGSDSSPAITPPPVTPPVTPLPTFKVQDDPVNTSTMALSVAESFIQVGTFANTIIKQASFNDLGIDKSCNNGGISSRTINDIDGSNTISAADVISIDYRDCYIPSLNSTISGVVAVKIVSLNSDDGKTLAEVNLSDVEFDGETLLQFKGVLGTEIQKLADSQKTTVKNIGSVSLIVDRNADLKMNFVNTAITRSEQLSDATYSISGAGKIELPVAAVSFSFAFKEPLVGHFSEYPHKGLMHVFTSNTDIVETSSNFVTNSESMNVKSGSDIYSISWSYAVEGSLWWFSGGANNYVNAYRSDNFDFVGVLNSDLLTEFPASGGSVQFLMSRPVKSGAYTTTFNTTNWPYQNIAATVSVAGAIVSITPKTPLAAGREYEIDSFELVSTQDVTRYVYRISGIHINDAILMSLDKGTGLYQADDFPTLDASKSVMNKGTKLNFKWIDVNNVGLVFADKSASKTTFSAPAGHANDISVRLEIDNGQGYAISSDFTIKYFTPSDTVLHFVSSTGDYIGGGQTLTLDTSEALFNVSSNGSENEDHLSVSIRTNTWWTLDIAAPKGEKLALKKYENATRYPFQSPVTAGLSFTGDGRGCNNSLGSFEILELVYDANNNVEKLAVNFQQSCENTNPLLIGLLRVNSSAKLN
jgi:hypothetical protein